MNGTRRLLFSVLVLCLLCTLVSCAKETEKVFSAEGRVVCQGETLAEVSLEYDGGTVSTDDNGKFKIDGLTETTMIRADKEGYLFAPSVISVSFFVPVCEIRGYRLRDIAGRVVSGDCPVAGAAVQAVGALAEAATVTDAEGNFLLRQVAGELVLSVRADGYDFLDRTLAEDATEALFDGVYDAAGEVLLADGRPLAGVTVTDGAVSAETDGEGRYLLSGVRAHAEISASLAGYGFLPQRAFAEAEHNQISFTAYPAYLLTGEVKSGKTAIAGAKLTASFGDAVFSACSDADGRYELAVFGETDLCCTAEGFDFVPARATGEGTYDFFGTFPLTVRVTDGKEPLAGATVAVQTTDAAGLVELAAQEGEQVLPVLAGYHFDAQAAVREGLTFAGQVVYDLAGTLTTEGVPLEEVAVLLDGEPLAVGADGSFGAAGLWGTHELTARAEDCRVSGEMRVTADSCQAALSCAKLYAAEGNVHSGSLSVDGGRVVADLADGGQISAAVRAGSYRLEGLYGRATLRFVADGYTAAPLESDWETAAFDFAAGYALAGIACSGDLALADIAVTIVDEQGRVERMTGRDGRFAADGLQGRAVVTAAGTGYTFDAPEQTCEGPDAGLVLAASYAVRGVVFNRTETGVDDNGNPVYEKEFLAGVRIYDCDRPENYILTDEKGGFAFSGLRGRVTLLALSVDDETAVRFKPERLVLTGAGEEDRYYFEANAYQLSGSVTSGGQPVAGVSLVTGERTVTSTSDGSYFFEVLKSKVTVTPKKTGYTFTPESRRVEREGDVEGFDFTATYEVSGRVLCGKQPLAGVTVVLGDQRTTTDENGAYRFIGAAGVQTMALELAGYAFAGVFTVAEYETEHNFAATYEISGRVTTGELAVAHAAVRFGSLSAETDERGAFRLAGLEGSGIVRVEKEGFCFETTVNVAGAADGLLFDGTYRVTGLAATGGIPVSGARVTAGTQTTTVGADGVFSFEGLSGEVTLTAAKEGYDFAPATARGACETTLAGSYRYLVAVVGSRPIAGVTVSGFGRELVTDERGEALFTGLTGRGTLTFAKEGYQMEPLTVEGYSGADAKRVVAKFSVSGTVVSGELPIAGVKVSYGGLEALTDSRGEFTLSGLSGEVTLRFESAGYAFADAGVFSEYAAGVTVAASYTVSGAVLCEDGEYADVTVTALFGETQKTVTPDGAGRYEISGIVGRAVLRYERTGSYSFDFPERAAYEPGELEANACRAVYAVSGTVTAGGAPVGGVTVKAAGRGSTVTDSDGSFTLGDLIGSMMLTASLDTAIYENEAGERCEAPIVDLNGKPYTGAKTSVGVSGANSGLQIALDEKKTALALAFRGYTVLSKRAFTSATQGEVDAGAGGVQKVRGTKMQDAQGHKIQQNLNYGGTKFGVDPRVAQVSYVEPEDRLVVYQQNKNCTEALVGSYDTNAWAQVGEEEYIAKYGSSPFGYTPYLISEKTLQKATVSKSGSGLTFKLQLDASASTANYRKQVIAFSGQTPTFKSVELTYTVDAAGRLSTVRYEESYEVTVVITVTVSGKLTETFSYGAVDALTRENFAGYL